MISNGPSRTFTQEAVEAWFRRLCTSDWESHFSPKQLKDAQKYYREGYLSTIDIQENQAVITKKINREETYSVVEWNGKGPEIRTSLDEEELGIALATAGLYEIEELISELHEDDPLLGEGLLDEDSEAVAPRKNLLRFLRNLTLRKRVRLNFWFGSKYLLKKVYGSHHPGRALNQRQYPYTRKMHPS